MIQDIAPDRLDNTFAARAPRAGSLMFYILPVLRPSEIFQPQKNFPRVLNGVARGQEGDRAEGEGEGGIVRRRRSSPIRVNFPVDRSCIMLCASWLSAIRFHRAQAYSGKSSAGQI